jgi:hypothetical protein
MVTIATAAYDLHLIIATGIFIKDAPKAPVSPKCTWLCACEFFDCGKASLGGVVEDPS